MLVFLFCQKKVDYIIICEKEKCSGCGLCSFLCTKNCIVMEEDAIGHLYPRIEKEKCIECGICRNNCPANHIVNVNKANSVYACWALDNGVRKASTSGGIASVLSRTFIQRDGVVYGAALSENRIQHIRIKMLDEVGRLQGSKYVESPIRDILPQIKTDLVNNQNVLFFGTPCQCAAVRQIADINKKEIYLVELICTGVPPQKLLWEHLHIDDINKIRFRDEMGSRLTVWDSETKVVYQKPRWQDTFLIAFREHLILRDSCYNCKYASMQRVGDLTLGDYWGISKDFTEKFSIDDGISAMFVNSLNGKKLFDSIKDKIFYSEQKIEDAIDGNIRYRRPSQKHKNREKFVSVYKLHGYKRAIKSSLRTELIKYKMYSIKRWIRDALLKKNGK